MPRRASDDRPRPRDHPDPRAAGPPARRAPGRARVVRGGVAARADDGARPARLRPGPGQRRVERSAAAPPAGCTPSRGTSWSRSSPAARTARGSTCAPATPSARRTASTLEPGVAVFVPRGVGNGYQTTRRRDGVHLPGQRPLAPRCPVRRGRPRRSRARDRLAGPAGRARPVRARPHRAAARGRRARCRCALPWSSARTVRSAAPWSRRSRGLAASRGRSWT